MEENLDLFEKIINKVSPKVDYVDIRAGEGNSTNIVMKDNKIQEINTGIDIGARIRVLKNGAWGFAFTNDLNKLNEISETAIRLSNVLSSDVELGETEIVEDKVQSKAKIPVSEVTIDEKKEIITDASKAANIGDVVSTTVNYSDNESQSIFLSSEGSSIVMNETRIGLFLNAAASSEDIIQFGHSSIGGAKGFEVLKEADIEKFGRKIGEKATRLLKAKSPPSGRFPIITDCELTGVFIHEALGHAAEADLILQNDSILKGKMGEQIGSEIVNIIDDASCDGFGYYAYDAEGVKSKKNQLVKNGKLVSLLSSRESASKLNMTSSGNSRSIISEQPIVRMSNSYLEPGDMSFEELLEDINEGIYLKGSRGGQVDTGKGIFQFNAAESFKIDNGEITDHYRDVSLSGNVMETLKNVDALGSDFKLNTGFCGKSGQTAPVGDGGPHTRILDATVGGSN
ncbi:metalloprotease TldD [Methanobrevibacter cuticularis]|uniref:Metalloprotease TldD n=1 Tax=Methanobrevibacter cuticularis TaxID=47311 RepID=A0A166CY72_9EURY|nr:TldD/PmbA family protein [Methanobrevibacter cuticularis]KZX14988.1 metalloprotease TldD [Methanobrevibacter cuticularis]